MNIKNISIFFILFTTTFLHAQDISSESQTPENNISTPKKSNYLDFFGVTYGIGATSVIGGGSPFISIPHFLVNLEFKIPLFRKLYIYSQLRASLPLNNSTFPQSYLAPAINLESLKVGGLLGFGFVIKDNRAGDNTGVYSTLNFGAIVEGAVYNKNKTVNFDISKVDSIFDRLLNFGAEINTRTLFAISPTFKFSLGAHLTYIYSPFSGDPFYVGESKAIVPFHSLSYGITFGFHI